MSVQAIPGTVGSGHYSRRDGMGIASIPSPAPNTLTSPPSHKNNSLASSPELGHHHNRKRYGRTPPPEFAWFAALVITQQVIHTHNSLA